MTWHLLFTEFESQFGEIKPINLHGIVIKSRIGECGQGVIIISRTLGDNNYTVTALNREGPTDKPSDLIPWKVANKVSWSLLCQAIRVW